LAEGVEVGEEKEQRRFLVESSREGGSAEGWYGERMHGKCKLDPEIGLEGKEGLRKGRKERVCVSWQRARGEECGRQRTSMFVYLTILRR
jgi:hypothetical protein